MGHENEVADALSRSSVHERRLAIAVDAVERVFRLPPDRFRSANERRHVRAHCRQRRRLLQVGLNEFCAERAKRLDTLRVGSGTNDSAQAGAAVREALADQASERTGRPDHERGTALNHAQPPPDRTAL